MSDDSEEMQSGVLLKRSVKQPYFLQNTILAVWAVWYDFCGKRPNELLENTPELTAIHNKAV